MVWRNTKTLKWPHFSFYSCGVSALRLAGSKYPANWFHQLIQVPCQGSQGNHEEEHDDSTTSSKKGVPASSNNSCYDYGYVFDSDPFRYSWTDVECVEGDWFTRFYQKSLRRAAAASQQAADSPLVLLCAAPLPAVRRYGRPKARNGPWKTHPDFGHPSHLVSDIPWRYPLNWHLHFRLAITACVAHHVKQPLITVGVSSWSSKVLVLYYYTFRLWVKFAYKIPFNGSKLLDHGNHHLMDIPAPSPWAGRGKYFFIAGMLCVLQPFTFVLSFGQDDGIETCLN